MTYLLHLIIMFCLYAILGLSLNLLVGYSGMLSLCHAAFYGIGAYVSALLMVNLGWPFLPSLLAALSIAWVLAYLVAIPSTKLRGDFLVLATLAFQVIISSVLHNWTGLTKGPYGIPGIPKPSILGWCVNRPQDFVILAGAIATAVGLLSWRLLCSPYGRTLQAVRDDALAAQSLGKNTIRFRRSSFALGGLMAASSGVLFASYASFIDPTSFTLDESIFIFCVVIIGGAGNLRGPLVGALLLVLLPEALRLISMPDAIAANMRQIIYGVLLVLMMRCRPQGIAGRYAFD